MCRGRTSTRISLSTDSTSRCSPPVRKPSASPRARSDRNSLMRLRRRHTHHVATPDTHHRAAATRAGPRSPASVVKRSSDGDPVRSLSARSSLGSTRLARPATKRERDDHRQRERRHDGHDPCRPVAQARAQVPARDPCRARKEVPHASRCDAAGPRRPLARRRSTPPVRESVPRRGSRAASCPRRTSRRVRSHGPQSPRVRAPLGYASRVVVPSGHTGVRRTRGSRVWCDRGTGQCPEARTRAHAAPTRDHRRATVPAPASSNPHGMVTVVVLPAPVGPSNPSASPGRTSNEMPSTATRSPKRFVMP